jgi:hypothetical protein
MLHEPSSLLQLKKDVNFMLEIDQGKKGIKVREREWCRTAKELVFLDLGGS